MVNCWQRKEDLMWPSWQMRETILVVVLKSSNVRFDNLGDLREVFLRAELVLEASLIV